ncbi:MAG: hypothetical protein KGM43_07735 [Planctomycetota bacterium]|nr:hypothetical protein [Planctomycetota bacterium]
MTPNRIRNSICNRGNIAIIAALLMPVMLGFAALTVDTGIIEVALAQMGTAADAGALAGAMQIAGEWRIANPSNTTQIFTNADVYAQSLAQANSILGSAAVVDSNSQNATAGDVVVGYLDPTNPSGSTFQTSSAYASYYNSVQVNIHRNTTHTGPVPLFFANIFSMVGSGNGFSSANLAATATATAYNYQIAGASSASGQNSSILPIVLDQSTYNNMIARATSDAYTYDPATGAVSSGSDGLYESSIFPVGTSPGNWGTVKIGVSNNSTCTLAAQIQYGVTASELATYPGGVLQLDNANSPPSIQLGGNPGISAGIASAVNSIIGKAVTIPIYNSSGGNGNNAWYNVVQFAAVRVMASNFRGNPKYIIVQPAVVSDSTLVKGSVQSGWSQIGILEVHLTR